MYLRTFRRFTAYTSTNTSTAAISVPAPGHADTYMEWAASLLAASHCSNATSSRATMAVPRYSGTNCRIRYRLNCPGAVPSITSSCISFLQEAITSWMNMLNTSNANNSSTMPKNPITDTMVCTISFVLLYFTLSWLVVYPLSSRNFTSAGLAGSLVLITTLEGAVAIPLPNRLLAQSINEAGTRKEDIRSENPAMRPVNCA